jgi:nitrite reductase/ring-hydroxylating ferredoxin subunit
MWYEIFEDLKNIEKTIPFQKMNKLQVGKHKIALIKKPNNQWIAFKDACPHLQVPLTQGELTEDNCVLCRFHRYKFSLENGEEVQGKNTSPLKFYAISIKNNCLLIEIPDENLEEKDEFSF